MAALAKRFSFFFLPARRTAARRLNELIDFEVGSTQPAVANVAARVAARIAAHIAAQLVVSGVETDIQKGKRGRCWLREYFFVTGEGHRHTHP